MKLTADYSNLAAQQNVSQIPTATVKRKITNISNAFLAISILNFYRAVRMMSAEFPFYLNCLI